ncbi:MAG: GIY-YIG nuclease family protein [Pseudomonadota bacterium]
MSDRNVYLYILHCSDGSYYVGVTRRSLEERVGEHNAGLVRGYTVGRRPVRLVFSEAFSRIDDAAAAERQVKGWSRVKKEALISGRLDLLPNLARCRSRA